MKVNIIIIGQNKPDKNNKGFFLVTEYLNQRKIEKTINKTIVVTSIEEGGNHLMGDLTVS